MWGRGRPPFAPGGVDYPPDDKYVEAVIREMEAKKEAERREEEERRLKELAEYQEHQRKWREEMRPRWEKDCREDLPQDTLPAVKLVLERGKVRNLEDGLWGPGPIQRGEFQITVHFPMSQ
jgi:hypothetical protein